MTDLLTLVKWTDDGKARREVFCGVRSVGQREFYQAQAVDMHPELTFVLADYLDFEDEPLIEYDGKVYRVLRTYRTGQELEIVVERASAEEVAG